MAVRSASARLATLAVAGVVLAACTGGDAEVADLAGASCLDGGEATTPTGPDPLPVQQLGVLGEQTSTSSACWVGQPLVVNFWAEWCAPCKAEMPDLEAAHQAFGDRVRFVGVDYQDRAAAAEAFADEVGVTYELVEDPEGDFFAAVEGRGTPTTLLVDADGTIVHRQAGPVTLASLERLLADELGIT